MKPGDTLRKHADEVEARALADLEHVAEWRRLADEADRVSADPRVLTLTQVDSTLSDVNVNTRTTGLNIGRGKSAALKAGHPFVVALYARNLTVAAWARRHHVSTVTASSWVSVSSGARKIPLRWAKRIEAEFGEVDGKPVLPANDTTWPNGITG